MTSPVVLPSLNPAVRQIGRRRFDFSRQAAVMAVVNRTPDSFHDRGETFALDRAVEACLRAADLGADWVDIGGVPFSPDTPDIGADEELDRVAPVIEAVAARSDVVISVDTVRASVAETCVALGASVINDTSGLHDPAMPEVVRRTGATVVLTHSLAAPHVHTATPPHYDDIIGEVRDHLSARLAVLLAAGVAPEQVVLDPGHDLNKNTVQTLELTRRFSGLVDLGHPVLAAVSNKDFIGETLDRARGERVPGSLAAAMWCLMAGARVLRMHDVAASVDVVRMFEAIMGWRDPAWTRHNL